MKTKKNFNAVLKAIDKLVREGRAEHVLIDGRPGIRLIKKREKTDEEAEAGEVQVETMAEGPPSHEQH